MSHASQEMLTLQEHLISLQWRLHVVPLLFTDFANVHAGIYWSTVSVLVAVIWTDFIVDKFIEMRHQCRHIWIYMQTKFLLHFHIHQHKSSIALFMGHIVCYTLSLKMLCDGKNVHHL